MTAAEVTNEVVDAGAIASDRCSLVMLVGAAETVPNAAAFAAVAVADRGAPGEEQASQPDGPGFGDGHVEEDLHLYGCS